MLHTLYRTAVIVATSDTGILSTAADSVLRHQQCWNYKHQQLWQGFESAATAATSSCEHVTSLLIVSVLVVILLPLHMLRVHHSGYDQLRAQTLKASSSKQLHSRRG
jgi:hypothetical protein